MLCFATLWLSRNIRVLHLRTLSKICFIWQVPNRLTGIRFGQYRQLAGEKLLLRKTLSSANNTISVIAYIGSYCCYIIKKKLNCEDISFALCQSSGENETSFNHSLIRGKSGGNLLYPNADIMHIKLTSYIVIQKIACFEKFLWLNSQLALSLNSF